MPIMSPRHVWDRKDESRTTIPLQPEIHGIKSVQVVTGKREACEELRNESQSVAESAGA